MGRKRNYGGSGPITPEIGDSLLQVTRTITQAQMQALNTTEQEIVPAPGAGRTIVPISYIVKKPTAVAYGAGGNLFLTLGAPANNNRFGNTTKMGLDSATASEFAEITYTDDSNQPQAPTNYANQALNLWNDTANFTGAGGDVTVTVFYSVAMQ